VNHHQQPEHPQPPQTVSDRLHPRIRPIDLVRGRRLAVVRGRRLPSPRSRHDHRACVDGHCHTSALWRAGVRAAKIFVAVLGHRTTPSPEPASARRYRTGSAPMSMRRPSWAGCRRRSAPTISKRGLRQASPPRFSHPRPGNFYFWTHVSNS
jgi:hypothetical protein